MVAIKICGMREPANIAEIGRLAPDYMGFICWPDSKRFVGESLDAAALSLAGVTARRIGVFVNPSIELIRTFATRLELNGIQLHGEESPEFCREVRAQFPRLELWKALQVGASYPHEAIACYQDVVDRVLLDTETAARGGSGRSFDWAVLDGQVSPVPLVLAGGLGPDNIEQALQHATGALSVFDLNSRLESAPGVKDPEITARVVAVIRSASGV